LNLEGVANFYIQETNGSYICCDVFEPGYGYLFTDCGGEKVVVLDSKLNDTYVKNESYVA
jgi:hypothetical protein